MSRWTKTYVGGKTRGEGRGVHHKTLVAAAVEVRHREPGTAQDKRKDGRFAGRVRLSIAADRSADSLCGFVGSAVMLPIPTKPPPRSEKIAPPDSEMMSPPRRRGRTGTDGCCFVRWPRQAAGSVFVRRMLSPGRSRRGALWTRRARIASAYVGSAMT